MKPIYIFSILVLFLAISFSIILTRSSDFIPQRARLSFFRGFFKFPRSTPVAETSEPPYCVWWMAPFLSGGGYSSEAWSYISSLNAYIKNNQSKPPLFKLTIDHHGDLENVEFWNGLPFELKNLAMELYRVECRPDQTIVVCHSEPGAWYPPLFQTLACPPGGYSRFKAVVGRTMFETDRLNHQHVRRCNQMDYVWVPTDFHSKTFSQSGVDPVKLRKIIQPVDSGFFDPSKVEPLDLYRIGSLVLGLEDPNSGRETRFVFLSMFKWEYRKGWDVLLRSYLEGFSGADDVALYLLTNAYHSDRDFGNKISAYVEGSDLVRPTVGGWAPVYVIDQHIPQVDLPRLYKAADAFVLPSRGEGWGRPIVEAMAMSLPVIATNWSGPTEYLNVENGYPLGLEGMGEVREGPFRGHLWAEPSVAELRSLMRHVVRNPGEAKAKGVGARLEMVRKFSPEIVADALYNQLVQIVQP